MLTQVAAAAHCVHNIMQSSNHRNQSQLRPHSAADGGQGDEGGRLYGRLKAEDEADFAAAAEQGGFRAVIARVYNIAGPGINKLDAYALGSILAGGSSPPLGAPDRSPIGPWVESVKAYRAAAEQRAGGTHIPLMFGIDAVHGNNNVLGAVIYPHNIGLGAAHDPALTQRIGGWENALEVVGVDRVHLDNRHRGHGSGSLICYEVRPIRRSRPAA